MTHSGAQASPLPLSLMDISISESMLADACQLYADELPVEAREEFVDLFFSDDSKVNILKKAVLDVVVIACLIEESATLDEFSAQASLYAFDAEIYEHDDIVLDMKVKMLKKMVDDSLDCGECVVDDAVVSKMLDISILHFNGSI